MVSVNAISGEATRERPHAVARRESCPSIMIIRASSGNGIFSATSTEISKRENDRNTERFFACMHQPATVVSKLAHHRFLQLKILAKPLIT